MAIEIPRDEVSRISVSDVSGRVAIELKAPNPQGNTEAIRPIIFIAPECVIHIGETVSIQA